MQIRTASVCLHSCTSILGIPFMYAHYVYWKMLVYQNVTPAAHDLPSLDGIIPGFSCSICVTSVRYLIYFQYASPFKVCVNSQSDAKALLYYL